MGLWSEEFVSEIAFSKCCSFDSGDFIKPKLGQKEPKIVFHVLVVIEKWFFFSFDSPCDVINPKMGQKGSNWYFMYQCW